MDPAGYGNVDGTPIEIMQGGEILTGTLGRGDVWTRAGVMFDQPASITGLHRGSVVLLRLDATEAERLGFQ